MKLNFTHAGNREVKMAASALLMFFAGQLYAQTYPVVLRSPSQYVYGLAGNGAIYEIDQTTGAGTMIKNSTYSGNAANQSNGIAYAPTTNLFYYFKRNPGGSNQEFVSFSPATGAVTILATSPITSTIYTGCINSTGTAFYTSDVNGNFFYYNVTLNTWTKITSNFIDQDGNNVTSVLQSQTSGDMAMDANGNIWLASSNSSNYAIYKFPSPIPTSPVAQIVVQRYKDPSTPTPGGASIYGVAFDVNGNIILASSNDKMYLLQKASGTATFMTNLSPSGMVSDLTSQNFPTKVLPVKWLSFTANLQENNTVSLNWQVTEENNKGFYVEYSTDGDTWQSATFIPSKGNPGSVQSYSYDYTNKINGKICFRIKQVDIDDQFSYSSVKTISLNSAKQTYSVWPNPSSDVIHISGGADENSTADPASLQIFDQSGKMITSQKLQTGINTINISKFISGVYFARIQNSGENAFIQKIVKQ